MTKIQLIKKLDINELLSMWRISLQNWKFHLLLLGSTSMAILACITISYFFVFIQSRNGFVIYDPILESFGPYDVNEWILYLTSISVFLGLASSYIVPQAYVRVMIAICVISAIRIVVLSMVPLEPPETIIPLRDAFLESTFYQNQVITKDLFFSGHAANVILLALLSPFKFTRRFLLVSASILGILLVAQHVHYTIDVIAAPFFAYFAYLVTQAIYTWVYEWSMIVEKSKPLQKSFFRIGGPK